MTSVHSKYLTLEYVFIHGNIFFLVFSAFLWVWLLQPFTTSLFSFSDKRPEEQESVTSATKINIA